MLPFMSNFSHRQKATVMVLAVVNFCSAICVSLQAPFYPLEAEKKGITPSQYGFVFGIFELTVFFVSPVLGKNLSSLGAKRVFNVGILTTGLCSILFGLLDLVHDSSAFLALSLIIRSVEAAGNSGFLTASFAIIAEEFPQNVATMFASLETCFGLGLILGPSVGGCLYDWGGYTLPFVTMGALLVGSACFTYWVLPMNSVERHDLEASRQGFLTALKVPSISLAALNIVIASISLGYIQTCLEPHFRSFKLTAISLGLMFVVNGASYAVSAPFWGWLCDQKVKPNFIMALGSTLCCVSFIFLGPVVFVPLPTVFQVCIASLVVHGIGFAAQLVSGFSLAHREAVKHGFPDNLSTYALISSLWTSSFALGAFLGPSVAGLLFERFGFGWASLLVVIAEIMVSILSLTYIAVKAWRKRFYTTGYESICGSHESIPQSVAGRHYGSTETMRRSSSSGHVITVPSDLGGGGQDADLVPRSDLRPIQRSISRGIFTPFPSPYQDLGILSMMGCSMPAAACFPNSFSDAASSYLNVSDSDRLLHQVILTQDELVAAMKNKEPPSDPEQQR